MLPIERNPISREGLYLNKNIYDQRDLLIWPTYTPVTPALLETAHKLGILLSVDDMTNVDEALLEAVDTAFDELAIVFKEAGDSGQARVRELRRNAIPMLKSTLSTGSLTLLLVHLRRKDDQTLRHSVGVGALSLMFGRWLRLSEEELDKLTLAALLHDIGKLRIDRSLLTKPGKLNIAEYEEIKKHTIYGYEMLYQLNDIPEECAVVALRHHERFNGTGYPSRLAEKEIDLLSRIISITDVFHAMSSKRPYKDQLPFYRVIREMHSFAFDQFDPSLALVFLTNVMQSLIGTDVVLTNGKRARIVSLNGCDLFRPLVRMNDEFIDLSKNQSIHIESYA